MNLQMTFIVSLLSCLTFLGCAKSTMFPCEQEKGRNPLDFKNVGDARQIVLVTNESKNDFHATLTGYEKINGQWQQVFGPYKAVIGKKGFSLDKHEGDGASPAGLFAARPFFGSAPKPENLKFPYRQTHDNDFWVDDPKSPFYNTWQTGPAEGRWKSAEILKRPDGLYKYVAVIQYNIPPVAGKGSAIFFHIWKDQNTSTSGCTAMDESNVLRVLQWLDPEKKPIFLQGSSDFIKKYKIQSFPMTNLQILHP
jgi:L,D-peptidoglycan transpeptidase YkuD (ErfK/YbiS/YcfS/YnhG family)